MKNILHSIAIAILVSGTAFAQLPAGSTAQNFTITDIDGNTHNLYDILDEGTPVILDLFAVWVGPCWSYAETGVLEEVNSLYGPEGSNEVFVITVESDSSTPESLLYGGSNSIGDWTSIIDYPLADDADASIANDYALAYYPTIYMICPDRKVTEVGQLSSPAAYYEQFSNCSVAVEGTNAGVVTYDSDVITCSGSIIEPVVSIQNLGTETLTACTINTLIDGQIVSYFDWTGSLNTYATSSVTLAEIPAFDTNTEVTFTTVLTGDVNAGDDAITVEITPKQIVNTNQIQVQVNTAYYPGETSWEIRHEDGTLVSSTTYEAGTEDNWGAGGTDADMVHNYIETLANGCYTFIALDAFGDGQTGYSGMGAGTDGSIVVTGGDGQELLNISGNWGAEQSIGFEIDFTGIPGCTNESAYNFNQEATIDDGSCIIVGCTQEWADNYNVLSDIDDGSCELTACPYTNYIEYNSNYTISDINMCQTWITTGCTNIAATNYNQDANVEDGTCVIVGCLNPSADNFNSEATIEEENSCIINGCTNSTAENYTEEATIDNGSCIIYGCTLSPFSNYNPEATYDDGSCSLASNDVYGCTDPTSLSYNSQATINNGTCEYLFTTPECEEGFSIILLNGWNLIGYSCDTPINAETAFEPIIDILIIAKDNSGNAYLPLWNFNGIGDLFGGFGYQLKITEQVSNFNICD